MAEGEIVYDAAIIGSGPAGLTAAYELMDNQVILVEKGAVIPKRVCPMTTECLGCNRCGEIEGVGPVVYSMITLALLNRQPY